MITIDDAKKGIQAVIDFLKENESAWNESRNLKLYDVSWKCSDIIEKYPLVNNDETERENMFYWFCEDSYEQFTEWMQEENITDCRKYIGRTSSFYLTDLHNDDISEVIEELIDDNYGWLSGIELTVDDNSIEIEIDDEDEAPASLDYLANDFIEDVKRDLSDAIRIAKYIDDFKEHQIEYFKEYIEGRNDILEYMAKEEAEKEQAFIDKYADAIKDITKAIENVIQTTGCTISEANRIIGKAMEQAKPMHIVEKISETA